MYEYAKSHTFVKYLRLVVVFFVFQFKSSFNILPFYPTIPNAHLELYWMQPKMTEAMKRDLLRI